MTNKQDLFHAKLAKLKTDFLEEETLQPKSCVRNIFL